MPTRTQTLRSSVKGIRPTTGTREVGELYINFADRQIGMIDAGKAAVDLVPVRFFAATSDYVVGDFVIQGGQLYRASTPITAGAFNVANWDLVPGTPADLLTAIKNIDGSGSGIDADLLDGQSGAYYTTMGNQSGVITDAQHGNRAGGSLHPLATSAVAGFMTDAPSDGTTYSRRNAAWLATTVFVDAPNDANAYVRGAVTGVMNWIVGYTKAAIDALLALKAPLATPAFTGTPTAPTPTAGNNSTLIATTAFVQAAATTAATKPMSRPTAMVSGSGTWNRPAGCRFIDVEVWGGGGGGGGVASTGTGAGAAGGGGGAGGYSRKFYDVTGTASFAWTVGGAGSGGGSAAAGSAGGQSNFGPSVVAGGGSGGNGSAAIAANFANTYGGAGGAGAGGDINGTGSYGGNGTGSPQNFSASLGGAGANSSPMGGGALPLYGSSAGGSAVGYASGGGGACNGSSQGAAKAGGPGQGGLILVTEYY